MTEAFEKTAWLCSGETALPEWLDMMGHVNIQYYFGMAARSVYEMMDHLLRPNARGVDKNKAIPKLWADHCHFRRHPTAHKVTKHGYLLEPQSLDQPER